MEVRSPALLPNILRLAAEKGERSAIIGKVMVAQWRRSISIECGPVDGPLAALIFYPVEPKEFIMCGLFSSQAADHLTSIVRIGQLSVRRLAEDSGGEITCSVLPGKSPGYRLATMLGFSTSKAGDREQIMRF
ncbi:MAG: hypothetical protein JKY94_10035 [Rhodobacteraceae bacterium]|nr:hypothetical protein [Paracoccaceae bacterium]